MTIKLLLRTSLKICINKNRHQKILDEFFENLRHLMTYVLNGGNILMCFGKKQKE